jgi:hypothetical protein
VTTVCGVTEAGSSFGHPTAHWVNGHEIAPLEGDGVVEVRLTKPLSGDRRRVLKADGRVTLRPSGADWISVRFDSADDLDFILDLVTLAAAALRPPPGVAPKPPPTPTELERRRRVH